MNELVNETVLIGSVVLLWVLVLFNLVLTLGLVRRANANAGPQPMEEEGLEAGEQAPDFTAETLDGKPVSLATYAGRAVVFLFMSPSCEACREQLPTLEVLGPAARQAGKELVYVSNAGATETLSYVQEFGVTLPVIVAPPERSSFPKDYKITNVPSYCLVDAWGKVQSSGLAMPGVGKWGELVEAWQAGTNPRTVLELEEVRDGIA